MYIHPAFASSTGVLLLSRILFAKLVADHSGQRISEAQFSCGDLASVSDLRPKVLCRLRCPEGADSVFHLRELAQKTKSKAAFS
jgi:hypothetical protein